MNGLEAVRMQGALRERRRCIAILDDTILGWSQLIEDVGPNADATVESIIDSLLIARTLIEAPNQQKPDD